MRIHIAADHAGFELRKALIAHLTEAGHEVTDHGAQEYDPLDNYPTMCIPCAQATVEDEGSLGIVIGGSGNGEQIAANKVRGVRAALVWSHDTAVLAREHNDANVMAIGARQHSQQTAIELVDTFLATKFSAERRHERRIELVKIYEEQAQRN